MTSYKVGMAEEAVIADLTAKLVESQAREAKLREALNSVLGFAGDVAGGASWWDDLWEPNFDGVQYEKDDTDLKEYRKKVLLEAADWFDKDAGVYGMDSMWSLSGEKLRRMAEE